MIQRNPEKLKKIILKKSKKKKKEKEKKLREEKKFFPLVTERIFVCAWNFLLLALVSRRKKKSQIFFMCV